MSLVCGCWFTWSIEVNLTIKRGPVRDSGVRGPRHSGTHGWNMLLPDTTAVLLEQRIAMSDGCPRAQRLRVTGKQSMGCWWKRSKTTKQLQACALRSRCKGRAQNLPSPGESSPVSICPLSPLSYYINKIDSVLTA